jgi:hypothetical protein
MVKSMDMENSPGLMAVPTMASLLKITSMDREFINGRMADNTKDPGKIIKWKDMVFSPGQIIEDTKDSTWMIRRRDSESSTGLMAESMMVIGLMESSMELELTHLHLEKLEKVSGLKARGLHGYELILRYLSQRHCF